MDSFTPQLPTITHVPHQDFDMDIYQCAEHQYNCIMEDIREFEEALDEDHEIALKLTHVGQAITLAVTEISYAQPSLMYYHGYVGDQKALLVQHVSQINFLMIAMPKRIPDNPPNRIGFR